MVERYDKVLVLSILDCVDGPYIFSMLLAFSRIFKTMLSHCGSVSPLIQPSKIRYFWVEILNFNWGHEWSQHSCFLYIWQQTKFKTHIH